MNLNNTYVIEIEKSLLTNDLIEALYNGYLSSENENKYIYLMVFRRRDEDRILYYNFIKYPLPFYSCLYQYLATRIDRLNNLLHRD